MKRAIIYVVILGVVCTGLGVAIGVAIEKRYTARHFPRIVRSRLLRHPGCFHPLRRKARFSPEERLRARKHNIFERIDRELGLSSKQRDEVKAILDGAKQEIKQARDEFRTQIVEVKKRSNAQILELLNPEQKEKFERLRAKPKIRERD